LLDDNCAHIEYNRLKTVLKSCQNCKDNSSDDDKDQLCQCQSCQCMCPVFLFVYVLFLFFTMFLEMNSLELRIKGILLFVVIK
jgi:hypothetical protein